MLRAFIERKRERERERERDLMKRVCQFIERGLNSHSFPKIRTKLQSWYFAWEPLNKASRKEWQEILFFIFFFFIFPFLFPLGFVCCFGLACLLKAVHGAVQVAIEFDLLYFLLIVIEISCRYYNPYIQNDYIRSIYNIFVISTKYNTFVVNAF